MSEIPFFSILIPTKNRSHLVGLAIKSVLNQSFADFEIVVSDNDDSETLTKDVVASFSDPRIKYVRPTSSLSMPDNWEFGLKHSTGQYITILEDKQALYPYALEMIHRIISSTQDRVVTWVNDHLYEEGGRNFLIKYFGSGNPAKYLSDDIFSKFVSGQNVDWYMPRMINSCVKRSLIDHVIQATPLEQFFNPVCPDLCAAFIQLNCVSELRHIDYSLCVTGGRPYSNGLSLRTKGETAKRFMRDIGADKYFHEYVPIKCKFLVNNVVINDFERIRNKLGGRLKRYTFAPETYLLKCYEDIISSELLGTDMSEERILWGKYLRTQELVVRKKVRQGMMQYLARRYLSKWLISLLGFNFYAVLRCIKKRKVFNYPDVLSVVSSSEILNGKEK